MSTFSAISLLGLQKSSRRADDAGTMIKNKKKADLPLIRLSSINPFLRELASRDVDPGQLLEDQGLPAQVPASSDLFVSALCMYAMVEQSADLANDPYIGATVGSKLDLLAWEPISQAAEAAVTVGDLLNRFVLHAREHSSSANYSLETAGSRATFAFKRVAEPHFEPAQNDAFYLGFVCRLMKGATGKAWDAESVLIALSEPSAAPPDFNEMRIVKGDRSGFRMSFPTEWLFERFEKSAFRRGIQQSSHLPTPRSLVESVHLAISPYIHEENLTVERVAELCGTGKRRLSEKLRARGTTIRNEIAFLRQEKATDALVNSDRRISRIAATVGFNDPTAFSRAFKNWTGQSPQQYRRNSQ